MMSRRITEVVFWYTVNTTVLRRITYDELEEVKYKSKRDLGTAGSVIE